MTFGTEEKAKPYIVEYLEEFRPVSWDDVKTHTPDDLWLVPEMISNTSTLLYGESESGKSFLASALVSSLTTGSPFLGCMPVGGPYRVAVAYTDDQGDREYKTRISSALPDVAPDPGVVFFRMPVMRSLTMWTRLQAQVRSAGCDVLVIDNMSQAADGDLNTNPAVRDFFEGVRLLVDAGIPVIVLGHSTQKASPTGGKSELPMGHSAIVQSVRWRVFVKRYADDTIKLTFAGNSARKHDVTVRHGDGANFSIVESNSADERLRKEQHRQDTTRAEHVEMADYVVANCQGKGFNTTAKELAVKYGKAESTMRLQLRERGLSALLGRDGSGPNTVWTRVG